MATKKPTFQSGTFDADATGHITLQLLWRPSDVAVEFADDPTDFSPSCDLNIGDDLGFTVVKEGRKWALKIHWTVKGTRTINWAAKK